MTRLHQCWQGREKNPFLCVPLWPQDRGASIRVISYSRAIEETQNKKPLCGLFSQLSAILAALPASNISFGFWLLCIKTSRQFVATDFQDN